VYNRGVEKRNIFIEDEDYAVFLNLFKRYLSDYPVTDNKGREYDWLTNKVEIIAFCLMPNHFHILFYQIEIDAITKLLRSVFSAYTTYFNKKYNRVGSLFQGVFKASKIYNDNYLIYITRYIHRNPSQYMTWKWSSLNNWLGNKHAEWIKPQRLNNTTPDKYIEFITDDQDYRLSLEEIGDTIAKM
jgi:putative transposase